MKQLLIALAACAKLCSSLGYEYYAEDDVGCICAEHVNSLDVISNFKAKLVGEVIYSKDEPKLSQPTPPSESEDYTEEEY